jgi:hypothetical protein
MSGLQVRVRNLQRSLFEALEPVTKPQASLEALAGAAELEAVDAL